MKSVKTLPDEYRLIFSVNLQKDKKMMLLVNGIALIIAAALAIPMHFYISIATLFDIEHGLADYIVRFVILFIAVIAYLVLHELVHGFTMKLCGTKKINYGFTGIYAFAGSDDYYDKTSYIIIALAPVIVLGTVLAVINSIVSHEWFWVIYIVQITNISGAAGDLYVTWKFAGFPKDILVRDNGVSMLVYSKS